MVRWHRDVDAEYGDCSFICTILFAEPAAEDMGSEAPKTAKKVRFLAFCDFSLAAVMPHRGNFTEQGV